MARALLLAVLPVASARGVAAAESLEALATRISEGRLKGVTGALVSRRGETVLEAYARGWGPGRPHDIRSATKSITAILIGELVEDDHLEDVSARLSDLLPSEFAHLPPGDPRRGITVEDALTMRTGLACDDWTPASVGHEDKMYRTPDWVEFILRQPLAHDVGEHFSYCTGGVVVLGRVIEKLAGRSVPELAEERLFGPLGIEGAGWAETPTGHTDTGGHLRLTLPQMHVLGRLVLAGGVWNGERLISRKWLEAMTQEHTPVPGRASRYGYLWWLNRAPPGGGDYRLVFAHGNGGNFIFVVPELALVAAFTGTNYGSAEQFAPARLLVETIIPALVERAESGRRVPGQPSPTGAPAAAPTRSGSSWALGGGLPREPGGCRAGAPARRPMSPGEPAQGCVPAPTGGRQRVSAIGGCSSCKPRGRSGVGDRRDARARSLHHRRSCTRLRFRRAAPGVAGGPRRPGRGAAGLSGRDASGRRP